MLQDCSPFFLALGSALLLCDPSSSHFANKAGSATRRDPPLFFFVLIVVLGHLRIHFSISFFFNPVMRVCFRPLTHARQKPPNSKKEGGEHM